MDARGQPKSSPVYRCGYCVTNALWLPLWFALSINLDHHRNNFLSLEPNLAASALDLHLPYLLPRESEHFTSCSKIHF